MKKLKKTFKANENSVYAFAANGVCICAAPCACPDLVTQNNQSYKDQNSFHSVNDKKCNN